MKKILIISVLLICLCVSCVTVSASVEAKKEQFKITSCCVSFDDVEVYFTLSDYIKKSDDTETIVFSKIEDNVSKCAFSVEEDTLVAFPAEPAKGPVVIEAKSSDGTSCRFELYIEFVSMADRVREIGGIVVAISILAIIAFYLYLFVRKYSGTLFVTPVDSRGEVTAESVSVHGVKIIPVSVSALKKKAVKRSGDESPRGWTELNLDGFFYSRGKNGIRFIPEKTVYIMEEGNPSPSPRKTINMKKGHSITVYSDSLVTRGVEIKFN